MAPPEDRHCRYHASERLFRGAAGPGGAVTVCGIVGIALKRGEAAPILVEGLKRLEYRGYDSAGVAIVGEEGVSVVKGVGTIDDLERRFGVSALSGGTGIGHTRWATHGGVTDANAHPHTDCSGRVAVVHNGVIDNFSELRRALEERGHVLRSDTDTEVIPHLVEEGLSNGLSPIQALARAASMLEGSYAIAAVVSGRREVVVARRGSPLVLGVGDWGNMCASDVAAMLHFTNRYIPLEDGEVAEITPEGVRIWVVGPGGEITPVEREPREVDWTASMADKGPYDHFMLKEIYEQPSAIERTLSQAEVYSDRAIDLLLSTIDSGGRVVFAAAGTSYHASLVGKYLLARLAGIQAESYVASEFEDWAIPHLREGDLVFAISQSGETADVLMATRAARKLGARVLAMVNVPGSTLAREADEVLYMGAGPEVGVAATKTYTSQVAMLTYLTARLALRLGRGGSRAGEIADWLPEIPKIVEARLEEMDRLSKRYVDEIVSHHSVFFLGRGINLATSLEGALKLKEISYIHAEGFPGGEYKHGPLALISRDTPAVAILPREDRLRRLMVGNIMEVRARGAKVIVVKADGEEAPAEMEFPAAPEGLPEELTPIPFVVPLQLLAYRAAVALGRDPDKPRNLAKSVTVI